MTQRQYHDMMAALDRIEAEHGLARPQILAGPGQEAEMSPQARARWILYHVRAAAPEDWALLERIAGV